MRKHWKDIVWVALTLGVVVFCFWLKFKLYFIIHPDAHWWGPLS